MLFDISYDSIISVENLLAAWGEFIRGKNRRVDVQEFQMHLMSNIFNLHRDLTQRIYRHGAYEAFNISDPKPRNIHKASVRDRLLHHAIYRRLYPYFDLKFIHDSYSCRNDKGTYRAIESFRTMVWHVSNNHTHTAWVLKCDIRKFFASIDHCILIKILHKYVHDRETVELLENIISSFCVEFGKGLPLGNLTSQLLVNIYMNEFDQYMKRNVKIKQYIRYADDFLIVSQNRSELLKILPQIKAFLAEKLQLELHPKKVSITTIASGVDFLGWVHFPCHRVLRTATKRRVVNRLQGEAVSLPVYNACVGLLTHGHTYKLLTEIRDSLRRN